MAIIVKRSVTGGESDLKAEMLDTFYPVGSYYETSDTNFDPNIAWGGTWLEDSAGRVLVAMDSGTFGTVGDTGGAETHAHDFRIGLHRYYGALIGDDMNTAGAWSYAENKYSKTYGVDAASSTHRNNALAGAMTQYNENVVYSDGDTKTGSSLQPYTVIKRWHRTA